MNIAFLSLVSAMLPKLGVPTDVAPPPGTVAAISVGILIALGLFVAVIVVVSFLVIRAIRKNNSRKDGP
jgi:uncharacterized membrane protein (DUF485 family)